MNNRYEVKPRPYRPPKIARVTADERKRATRVAAAKLAKSGGDGFHGCGTLVLAFFVLIGGPYIFAVGFYIIGLPAIIGEGVTLALAVALTLALIVACYFAMRFGEIARLSSQRIQSERQRIQQEQVSIETEARNLTFALSTLHTSAPNHLQSLGHYIDSADSDLDAAEHEFNDGAFAPFWDAIERAVNNLSSFDHTTRELTGQAKHYYVSLRDRDHTFPQFPVALTTLPDPTHTTSRLQVLFRKAQRDFHFATIYEQRKTNNILKQGFMSLSSAIADLGSTLQTSIDDLRDSVSTGFTSLVEQQIATRDSIDSAAAAAKAASEESLVEMRSGHKAAATNAQEQRKRDEEAAEMLDNVQRRRKPFPRKPGDGAY